MKVLEDKMRLDILFLLIVICMDRKSKSNTATVTETTVTGRVSAPDADIGENDSNA